MATHFALTPPSQLYRGQRVNARARLNMPARVVTVNGSIGCTLVDVSQTGGKVACSECPPVGAMVLVEGLPRELFGTVRWSTGEIFGLEFDVSLPLEDVVAWRHHAEIERERLAKSTVTYARNWVQGIC